MDSLNSDLLIQTISFLNIVDSTFLSYVSRRLYYLVIHFRKFQGPQLLAVSSELTDPERPDALYRKSLERLHLPPNLVIGFNNPMGGEFYTSLNATLPPDAVCLAATATDVQANIDGRVDCQSATASFFGHFSPEMTKVVPFALENCDAETLLRALETETPEPQDNRAYWKAFLVYICGSGFYSAENFISKLQQTYVEATVVGGICERGHVSDECKDILGLQDTAKRQADEYLKGSDASQSARAALSEKIFQQLKSRKHFVREFQDGIFGLALGGDVPVRSIVSRGVRSVTDTDISNKQLSKYLVEEVEFARPADENYMFRGDPELLKPTHIIHSIRNRANGQVVSPLKMFSELSGRPEFVGIKREGGDGYELHSLSPFSLQTNSIVLMTDGSPKQEEPIKGASLDLFKLDPRACNSDMDSTLARLKEQTRDDVILGGVMYSCNGRGPEDRSLLGEEMADATRFRNHFPDVPCLGFYAGGEIGPMAMVGNENVFQKGQAAVQGFTAVFALLIVPDVKPTSYHLDDSHESVTRFLNDRMAG